MANFLQRLKTEISLLPSTLKYLPGEIAKTTKKFVNVFAPGKGLAKGVGYTFSLPYVEKTAEEVKRSETNLYDTLLQEYKKANQEGDEEKKQRLEKIIKDFKITNVIGEALADAPTTREILASATELALIPAFFQYTPSLPTGKLVYGEALKAARLASSIQKTAKIAQLSKTGKIVEEFVKPVATQAAIGGGFFAAMKAHEKEATINDIIKSFETGALISGGITAATIGISKGIAFLTKKYGPQFTAKWQNLMRKLEETAYGKETPSTESQIDKTLSYIGEQKTFKQKAAGAILKGIQGIRSLETKFIDRYAPAKRIEARIAAIKGAPLSETEKIYRDIRLLTSTSDGIAEYKILDLINEIGKYDNETQRKALAWITQLDFIDRAKLGQTVAGNQSLDDLIVGLKKLAEEIGPDDMEKVVTIKNAIYNHNFLQLKERLDAGIIDKKTFYTLLKTHPHYIRHNVILDIDEKVAQGLSSSLNVTKTDITKAIGSAKNIQNPIEATIVQTRISQRLIEKNKILNNFVKAQEEYNLFPGMKKIAEGVKPEAGFGTISLFRNGVKEIWQVPEDIARALKNLDAPLTPGWWQLLTTPQKIFKKTATTFSPSFTLQNLARDRQTAAALADSFIESMAQKTGVTPKAVNLTKEEIIKLYKVSGGFGGSIFEEGESKILSHLEKKGIAKVMDVANPLNIIKAINEEIERSTRLTVFKKALERGLSPRDAALVARDATIDFAKMGSWLKPLNDAIPFLNARIQGLVNLPRALLAKPETFVRLQLYTSVYPTLALYHHNRRFESYANISPYLKNKYWIIMTGETDGIDPNTGAVIKVPQFITIAKGEGQALISGPIQYYLEKADKIDYRKVSEMLVDVLGSASPIEFQTWNGGNLWLTIAGQFGPIVSTIAGLAAGKVPYTGSRIVPESREKAAPYMQFRKTTPEILKNIGKILNYSPSKLEFIINSWGGLTQDAVKTLDIVYNVVRNKKIGGYGLTETPWGALTELPVIRRFVRESEERGYEREYRQKQKEKIQEEVETKKLEIYDKAEQIWQELNKKKTREEQLNYLNSLGDELTPEIKKRLLYLKRTRHEVEVLKPTDSVELRARYIYQRLNEMKDLGYSKEEMLEYLNKLEENRILTPSVREMIYALQRGLMD